MYSFLLIFISLIDETPKLPLKKQIQIQAEY